MADEQDMGASARRSRQILKRLDKAREGLFPYRTCPASRHVHIIVEGLLDPKCAMHRDLLGYEPEHMAESIASVLEGLWKARRWMKWEGNAYSGEWVPDLDAIAAQGIEARSGETGEARLDPQDESPVAESDAPTPHQGNQHG